MDVKTTCITLRIVKYKDSKSIVTALSRDLGRVSMTVNDGASRESRRRRALMMPGCIYDCVIDFRDNRQLQTIHDITPAGVFPMDTPLASTVILFICDFLNSILRDAQPDTNLFNFIAEAITHLRSKPKSVANGAIWFLIGLARLTGIEPDTSTYAQGRIFDMTGGVFRPTPPLHGRFLDPNRSAAVPAIARITPRNSHLYILTRQQRGEILDTILEYFAIHLGGIRHLPSLDILRSLYR